jgi:uncharacterized membrane protein
MLMPFLLVHICSAIIALLSGFMAMAFRKGSGLHGAAGTVFFVSMISMCSSGWVIAAFLRPNMLNVVVSMLTLYLVSTAWRAAKKREGGTDRFDAGAFMFVCGVILTAFIAAALVPAYDVALVIFGSFALFCAVTDMRMLKRGGLMGSQRLVRHLWRMSMALLIAALSFYPGQAKLFPMWLRETKLLLLPMLVVAVMAFYWRYRMSRGKRPPRALSGSGSLGNPVVSGVISAPGAI